LSHNVTESANIRSEGARAPARREARPWGWFEPLTSGAGYQVKRLMVEPDRRLSLQWHRHRDEQWVVGRGTARVTIGDRVLTLGRGQSAFVPRTVVHRIENLSSLEPLEIIEVQTGDYLGEDDIVRVEDDYGRTDAKGE
jgi:mannose-1-phosphate guanylyltransferase/mannose-6-phosphate isomerase